MFVGDLGDEDVEMTRAVAALKVPKAVILGNHDAWESFSSKGISRRLRECLTILGNDHLAYGVREVPEAGISIVGARPFSWGGQSLRSVEVYEPLYGVRTQRQSAAKIVQVARAAQHRDIVILAHNGPLGLGSSTGSIYGKDFGKPGGDWGDRDLALALEKMAAQGLRVRAVIAGHMHDRLVHPRGQERTRFVRCGETVFVNPAVVPRIRPGEQGTDLGYFVRCRFQHGALLGFEEVWVDAKGEVREQRVPEFVEVPVPPPLDGTEDDGAADAGALRGRP
jgi:uncharacterized protein (TIGR04168 family)